MLLYWGSSPAKQPNRVVTIAHVNVLSLNPPLECDVQADEFHSQVIPNTDALVPRVLSARLSEVLFWTVAWFDLFTDSQPVNEGSVMSVLSGLNRHEHCQSSQSQDCW